jgi:hypothetical protein
MPIGAVDGLAAHRLRDTTLISISESMSASSRLRSGNREYPATDAGLNVRKVAIERSIAHEPRPAM